MKLLLTLAYFFHLLGEKTHKYIGATETMLGSSIAGVLYGLLSAQPVLITGTTGPLLVLEESMFEV